MQTFMITRYEENGPQETERAIRLVCRTETNEIVAIWGSAGNRGSIDAVIAAGLPCEIMCETREPSDWARDRGHNYWVPEHVPLRVISPAKTWPDDPLTPAIGSDAADD